MKRVLLARCLLFRYAVVCIRHEEIWDRCCLTLDYVKKLRGITRGRYHVRRNTLFRVALHRLKLPG